MFKKPLIAVALAAVSTLAFCESADLTITKSFPLDLAEAVGEITVISREDIQNGAYTSIYDVLRSRPGVSVYRQGGDASVSKIRVAGFEDEQVLVLVDGVNTNDPYWGNQRLEFIDLNQVERIELVQGNSAVAFGGIGGAVISIITIPQTTENKTSVSSTYASQNTKGVAVQLRQHVSNDSVFSISGNKTTSDGYDLRSDTDPDTDSYEKSSANISVVRKVGVDEVFISVSKQHGSTMLDLASNEFNNTQDIVDHALTTKVVGYSTVLANHRVEVKHSDLHLTDNNRNPLDASDFSLITSDTSSSRVSVTGNRGTKRYSLSADHLRQEREDQYGWTYVENTGISASIDTSNASETVSPFFVVRHDDNKDWGNHFGGSVGIRLDQNLYDAIFSIGSSYRAPNASEAFSATQGERTNQLNTSWSLQINDTQTVTIRTLQAISLNRISQGAPNYGANIGKNKINFFSVEMASLQQASEWSMAYEYTDSRLEEHGWKQMPFIPESQIKARYIRFLGKNSLIAEFNANDGYFTNYNEIADSRQAGFGDLNLSHTYTSHGAWKIKTSVENIFDRQPEYQFLYSGAVQSFRGPGRFISVTLSYGL